MAFLHLPALPISVLDMLLLKQVPLLSETVHMPSLCAAAAAYLLMYAGFVLLNFMFVGCWPHRLMNMFGMNGRKQAAFLAAQLCFFCLLLLANWKLFHWRTHWYTSAPKLPGVTAIQTGSVSVGFAYGGVFNNT